jgi:Flp pilus assembly protein TadG
MSRQRHVVGKNYIGRSAAQYHCSRRPMDKVLSLFQRFQSDESGNVIILGAIILPVAAGAVAAAVAYSSVNATRSSIQASLDSAVLAGVISSDLASAQIIVAQKYFPNNISSYASKGATNITANFTSDGIIITGEGTGSVNNPFGGLGGLPRTIQVKMIAKAKKDTVPLCILGLNATDSGSIDMNGNSKITAPDCAMQGNSTSNSGLSQEGKPQAALKKIGVTGNYTGDGYTNLPTAGAPSIPDPYASTLAKNFPTYDTCPDKSKGLDIKSDTTLSPGTYCGGIHIFSQAKVTLQPGVYVMNGGPFWVNGGSTVTGNDVMIAFTGDDSTFYAEGNSTINLTSPSSGPYINIQFFEDPNQTIPKQGIWFGVGGGKNNDIADGTKATFDGLIYVPKQNVWDYGAANMTVNSPTMAIVAEKIWVQGNVNLTVTNNNNRNLTVTPKPTMGLGARLIQ